MFFGNIYICDGTVIENKGILAVRMMPGFYELCDENQRPLGTYINGRYITALEPPEAST